MTLSNEIATVSSQTTKNRTISWASSMVMVEEIDFYPNPKLIWYQEDELKDIRKEIRKICSRFCVTDDFRGLEVYMDPSSQRSRTQRRREVTRAIIEEQHEQREEGSSASDSIAELYQELSAHFTKEAQGRALQDQKDAENAYQEQEVAKTKKALPKRNSFSGRYSKLRRSVIKRVI